MHLDTICLEGLCVQTEIGTLPWEKGHPQKLILDITASLDLGPAAVSDQLTDTVDYAGLSEALTHWAATRKTALIEKFASDVCDFVLKQYPIAQVQLRLTKPGALPQGTVVRINMTRTATSCNN